MMLIYLAATLMVIGMIVAAISGGGRKYLWMLAMPFVVVALSGCGSTKEFYETQQLLIKEAMALKAKAVDLDLQREKTRTAAMDAIKGKLDASGAAAIGVAQMMQASGGNAASDQGATDILKLVAMQKPPESWDDKALKWAAVLMPAAGIWGNVRIAETNADVTKASNLALYDMIARINRDTGAAIGGAISAGRPDQPPSPTYDITVNGSQGVGIGGNGSYQGPINLACSGQTGYTGVGGAGASTSGAGAGGPGAASGASGAVSVPCSVTR